ncbi:MAG: DUF349 domain-containing protein [Bacteroidia bacterium]|nr:DUF349 domain-containing protein [Bacteroidia bacterium]
MHHDNMNGNDPLENSAVPETEKESVTPETQEEAVHQETPEMNSGSEQETESPAPETEPQLEETPAEAAPEVTSETPETQAEEPETAPEAPAPEPEPVAESSEEVSSDEKAETAPEGEAETGEESEEEPKEKVISPEDKLFNDLVADEDAFEKHVDKASFQELMFLMEKILQVPDIGPMISMVKTIKKAFDQMRKDTDEAEQDLQSFGKFSLALSRFNRRRQEYFQKQEDEKAANSAKKQELLDRLKAIVEEERVQDIQEVREIQNAWKDTGYILQKDVMPINTMYKYYLDIYYNLRGQYHELLDTDRKYNLEQKQGIIEEINNLVPADETATRDIWRANTDKIKALQEFWKTVGSVPREDLDANNAAYREALDSFFSKRGAFFGNLDAERKENGDKKRALLEELGSYESYTANQAKEWNQATKRILAIQERWNAIGPATKDDNKILWKAYRNICNTFFKNKSDYFASFDEGRNKNLELKMAIIEKAEALKDSENLKETADALKALQAEWKAIGPVHDRHSNRIWKRFRAACDHFFSRKEGKSSSDREEFGKNLEAKLELIKKLHELNNSEEFDENSLKTFKKIQEEWKSIGHVPFRQKDDVNEGFRSEIDTFFKKAESSKKIGQKLKTEAQMNLIADDEVRNRRAKSDIHKIRLRIQESQNKIDSYETNILYIAKGKKGDALRKQIRDQIEAEKKQVENMKAKIKSMREILDKPREESPKPAKPGKSPASDTDAGGEEE